ncbi:pilin [Neisseria sp. Dent CA1/247]|uniref:pilin n=1 Tax=Neisseria sp. Dent CA1/247 TaxID=2912675 RepID=UPI00272B7C27|nr:pilin [Neisseria sp. Dent CA1/247]
MTKKNAQGYTLIELMTVVGVIGILAALALPMYGHYTARAQSAEGLSLLKALKTPLVEAVSTGSVAQCNNQAAWFTNEVRDGRYVEKIEVSSDDINKRCLLKLTFKSDDSINDNIKGRHISVRYSMNTGTWECGSDLNENLIASACSNGMLTLD